MKYIKAVYDVPRCIKLSKVEYYAFNDRVTEEKIDKFLRDKQDELECEVADFLVKVLDYTEEVAIFQSRVDVDWDFIDVNADWFDVTLKEDIKKERKDKPDLKYPSFYAEDYL